MDQRYWLDLVRPAELLRVVLHALAGGARMALEGGDELLASVKALPGAQVGVSPPFRSEYDRASTMVVVPLETADQAERLVQLLTTGGRVNPQAAAIQVEKSGQVEFLAGDSFHRECVSVGPLVPSELLRRLTTEGVIRGFYTPAQAREHFGIDRLQE